MNRPCINCRKIISVKTLQQKYCNICGPIIQKQKKDILNKKRYQITKRDFDLYCTKCFESLPIGSHADKMYCEKCLKVHTKLRMKRHGEVRVIRRKLNKFYKNLQFNLIQSPYFVDRKSLFGMVMVENK